MTPGVSHTPDGPTPRSIGTAKIGVKNYKKKEALKLGSTGKTEGVNMIKIHYMKFLKN